MWRADVPFARRRVWMLDGDTVRRLKLARTPFPSRIERYGPRQKAIAFQGVWYGDSGIIIRNNRYDTEPGHGRAGLIAKSDGERGYELLINGQGAITFTVRGDNTISAGTRAKVNDGPQYRDFCGRPPAGKGRDAGAMELAP